MDKKAIEALVMKWAEEAVAAGRFDAFDALLAEDVRDTSGDTETVGRATFKSRAAAVHAAFDDIRVRVDALVVEGESVAWRWTLTARSKGAVADGARVRVRGCNFQRVRDGRVVEHFTLAEPPKPVALDPQK
jgi:predicted ester cyclase